MCYFIDNQNIRITRGKEIDEGIKQSLSTYIIAPEFPQIPIITNESDELVLAKWRFNPALPEDYKTRTIGLNIRAEEAQEKKMFKDYTENHCIVPVNGFYEWKHINSKIKIKHYLTMKGNETFYLAGLWRNYADSKYSFGVLTTHSNELMTDIHNSKMRMPICLNLNQAEKFLKHKDLQDYIFPNINPDLLALNLEPEKIINTLF